MANKYDVNSFKVGLEVSKSPLLQPQWDALGMTVDNIHVVYGINPDVAKGVIETYVSEFISKYVSADQEAKDILFDVMVEVYMKDLSLYGVPSDDDDDLY